MDLSDDDWTQILEGTRSLHYKKDVHIVMQDQSETYRLFQISKGSCRIEKTVDEDVIQIAIIQGGEIFGEIAFLEGGGATASVVADEDDTVIHVIEGYYLDILFDYFPPLSGRFYHYLATVLSTRLKLREATQAKKKKEENTESEELTKDDFGTISKRRNPSRSMMVATEDDNSTSSDQQKKKTKSQRPTTTIEARKKNDKKDIRKQKRGSKLPQQPEQVKIEEHEEDKLTIAEKLEEKVEETQEPKKEPQEPKKEPKEPKKET